jgi:hypothetical protein
MKRTVVYLPEELYEGLATLAIENKISIAELIRNAVESVYREDVKKSPSLEREIAVVWEPENPIDFSRYMADRGLN